MPDRLDRLSRLGRYWRVLATGISFAAFGVGGLLLRVLVFPFLNLLVRSPERRIAWSREVIRLTFRAFVGLMRGLGVLRYQIEGLDKLNRGGMLILANHPTLIDTIFLMAFVKRADCIVKSHLWNNPFTSGPVRAAGYISNEGGAELIDKRLVDGDTVDDALLENLLGWLSPNELARYRSFVRRERRRQFLIGRLLVRQTLAGLLGVGAQQFVIEDGAGQKPLLAGVYGDAGFSISHSGRWVACAVTGSGALGLDIEMIDPARDITALAAQAFSEERCAWLAARRESSRLRDFYMLWSKQEAHYKLGAPIAQTVELEHPALSIVLCASRCFAAPPALVLCSLGAANASD